MIQTDRFGGSLMWTVRFERKAAKAIEALHPQMRRRITAAIDELATNPFNAVNVKALAGTISIA